MKLSEALAKGTALPPYESSVVYLTGVLSPDTDQKFVRLYTTPANRLRYLLIPQEGIQDEVYALTERELVQTGFVGETAHRIAVPIGTLILSVNINAVRVGEQSLLGPCSGSCPGGSSTSTNCSSPNTRCVSGCKNGSAYACCLYPNQPDSVCTG